MQLLPKRGLFLFLIYAGALLSQYIGAFIQAALPRSGTGFSLIPWTHWLVLPLFLAALPLIRRVSFEKIFLGSLLTVSSLLLLSVSFLRHSEIGYFLTSDVCARLLPFLGWASINQKVNPSEAGKSYFLLHFLVGVAMAVLSFILPMMKFGSSIPLWVLPASALLSIGLTLFFGKERTPSEETTEKGSDSTPSWISLASLSFLFAGLQCINVLIDPFTKGRIASSSTSWEEYGVLSNKFSLVLGLGIIFFSLLSLWLGPRFLRTRGWSFAAIGGVFISALLMLMTFPNGHPFAFAIYRSGLIGLQNFWIFPLVQISFLSYDRKSRFFLQALVCLVIAPLFENCSSSINVGKVGVIIGSLLIFSLMTLSSFKKYIEQQVYS